MQIEVGYDFKKYGYTLEQIRKEFLEFWKEDIDDTEDSIVENNPSYLMVMIENKKIIGWAIWHPSSTREHRKGYPRDKEDIKILEKLVGGTYEFIELHELWINSAYRGKGYGNHFFNFFEDFVVSIGFDKIIFYAFDHTAISICRKRGYKEVFNDTLKWHTFYKKLKN